MESLGDLLPPSSLEHAWEKHSESRDVHFQVLRSFPSDLDIFSPILSVSLGGSEFLPT